MAFPLPRIPVRLSFFSLFCVYALSLGACKSISPSFKKTPDRSVSHQLAIKPSLAAYQPEKDVKYVLPIASVSNETPVYPDSLPARQPNSSVVVIAVRLTIDEEGRVTKVDPLNRSDMETKRDYFESVVSACQKWTFTPLQARKTSVVPDGEVFGEPKVKVVTDITNLPFSLDYIFSFSEVISIKTIPVE